MAYGVKETPHGITLDVVIHPKSSRDEIVGMHGDALKIKLTAPPVDGKANAHLLRFLAGCFDVPMADAVLERGENGRDKQVRIRRPRRMPPALAET